MPRTLYAKLALALIVLVGALGISYSAFTLFSTHVFMQELNQRFNRDLARQLVVDSNAISASDIDQKVIREIFTRYMHINPAIEIYLLDETGTILAFEAPEMKIKRTRVDLAPIRRFLSGDMAYPIVGDDPRHESREKVFSAAELPRDGLPPHYLYVVLAGEDYDTVQKFLGESHFLQISLAAVGASMIVGLLAALYIFALLTRRLRHLAAIMENFRSTGFSSHLSYAPVPPPPARDEIDLLGQTFDVMAKRIIEQMKALEDKDKLRRNLVANVSHDLRTPLAALQGFLETLMMKTGELPVEERKHYLTVAYKHSERLAHLISDLFELAKLDAKEAVPDTEPVALAELLHDVVQKLQLRADQAEITVDTDVDRSTPLVAADIGMLERVLENLLGNALSHTPAGGRINVSLLRYGQFAQVSIANTGPGIPAADLPHVFERFYQSPEKRGRGAGLGLAIVKRIVELHQGRIGVSSSPNGTTEFMFQLPLMRP